MIEITNQSPLLADAMIRAQQMTDRHRDEFLMPEHLLWGIAWQTQFLSVVPGGVQVSGAMIEYLEKFSPMVPAGQEYVGAKPSSKFVEILNLGARYSRQVGAEQIDVPHILYGMINTEGSFAHDVLMRMVGDKVQPFLLSMVRAYSEAQIQDEDSVPDDDTAWMTFVKEMQPDDARPFIGRKEELERTMQILCRRDKNNPLLVGEAGVGKTALAYGLAARLRSRRVPVTLRGLKMYRLDTAALMAGTSMHGELEKRLKYLLDNLSRPNMKAILYIDDLYGLCGNGHEADSATGVLLPYMENGTLRFVASATSGDWNLCQSRNKPLARRFEVVSLPEPSVDECFKILQGIKSGYEQHHGIEYTPEALRLAVQGADKYITGRQLPDKAVDLIDEAAAVVSMRCRNRIRLTADGDKTEVRPQVDAKDIAKTLACICRVETLADSDDDTRRLVALEENIKTKVYGQDEAVHQVSEAVLMASAGLNDDTKPMASLLFVGPTGVGKTELARVLADQLGLPLIRLDMSEYAERHTVSKLIGSPAGYIGYDDGGVLTDAVRRTPHCVLLLDEIEKAHPDIYNTLLQVMDYGTLTDNRGQKADFRHTILLMTTNAGAQYAGQTAAMGFSATQTTGGAMMKEVRRTFKPEFLNRLTSVTIFHDMDQRMAERILDKKLDILSARLKSRHVKMKFTPAARGQLLSQCFSPKYGGREADRVLNTQLKPLLMKSILFGHLQNGGTAKVDYSGGQLIINK